MEKLNRTALTSTRAAVLQGLLVAFLWSTSWVLIKWGLEDIPPLTFAGLRYFLAWLCLLPVFARREGIQALRDLSREDWLRLMGLGLVIYSIAQGAQFVALAYLPAVTVNLVLGFTSILVALMGIFFIGERSSVRQWAGILLSVLGACIYFLPLRIIDGQLIGWIAALTGLIANSAGSILGRAVNRTGRISAITTTVISMGIGAPVMLTGGALLQGLPALSLQNWAVIAWLAVVNTAFAFTLYNQTLRTLSAAESSMVINSMSVQIPLLAVIFLGEMPSARQWFGLALVVVGIVIVTTRKPVP